MSLLLGIIAAVVCCAALGAGAVYRAGYRAGLAEARRRRWLAAQSTGQLLQLRTPKRSRRS